MTSKSIVLANSNICLLTKSNVNIIDRIPLIIYFEGNITKLFGMFMCQKKNTLLNSIQKQKHSKFVPTWFNKSGQWRHKSKTAKNVPTSTCNIVHQHCNSSSILSSGHCTFSEHQKWPQTSLPFTTYEQATAN